MNIPIKQSDDSNIECQSSIDEWILKANIEESEDIEYQKEFSVWEDTLSDGL